MKNLILKLFVVLTFATSANAQENSCCSKKEETKLSYYMSVGLSISNSLDTTFSCSSYPSIEFGGMYENLGVGLVLGRANLSGFNSDRLENYWYEIKASVSKSIGVVGAYALFGVGNYISTKRVFIEYGAGISYVPKKFGGFIQASNWDGYWYVTPGLVYNF